MRPLISHVYFLLCLLLAGTLHAQEAFYTEHGPNYSPYHTLYTQDHYLGKKNYDPDLAARAFKTGTLTERGKLAIKLKQVMDGKGLHVNYDDVPKNPDYIDSTTQTPVYRPFSRQPEIFIEKMNGKWYFSQATIEAIPKLHKEVYPLGSDIWVSLLPAKLHTRIFWLNTWQWLGIFIILVAGFIVQRILIVPFNFIIRRLSDKKVQWTFTNSSLPRKAAIAFSFFVTIKVISILIPTLQFSSATSKIIVFGLNIMAVTFLVIFIWRLIDIIMMYFGKMAERTETNMDEQMVPIVRKSLKILLILGAIIAILSMMDTNLTALLAGLSVGGLAIALAAQDTIKNMFGSLMIIVDKPFIIGDWITTDGINGTVENIGLRSTRIRTLEDSVIYVPNGQLADFTIDNLGMRQYRRFRLEIGVNYNTPPFLLQKFCDGIREIIFRHPQSNKDRCDVRLNNFGASSLDILLISFFKTGSNSAEWQVHHEILMSIIQLAHTLGVRFAFPTTSLHVESFHNMPTPLDTPVNNEQTEERFRQFFREFKPGWEHYSHEEH